ncbi:MAG TPA: potassium-transporting ATPase subunit F [Candidatus Bathyarchaeia archaeon]|nr:potassium-transporting ATPase subunit F [Candidatus Bathyarchaeia archaeon]
MYILASQIFTDLSITTIVYVAFVILGISLVGYLTYVLIHPERF